MSFKYPVPDEAQTEILRRNRIDPEGYFVTQASEDRMVLQNYDTGDEIVVRQNPSKKGACMAWS